MGTPRGTALLAYLSRHVPGFDAPAAERIAGELEPQGPRALTLRLGMQLVARGLVEPAVVAAGLRSVGYSKAPVAAQPLARDWGPYRGVRKLGEGGMGAVWEVEHALTGAHYALKTLSSPNPVEALRFQREAVVLSRLQHANVVQVHAGELIGSELYLVQELCTESLADRLQRGPLSIEEVRVITGALLAGLGYLHAEGIVHRDLKPANVLFDRAGVPKLADFGLVRRVGSTSLRLTQTGEVMGTPAFMAPEQALDSKLTGPAADVYALGAVVYASLAGHGPFSELGLGPLQLLVKLQGDRPPPVELLRKDVPRGLSQLCAACLEKEPSRRPSLDRMAHLLRDEGLPARRRTTWVLGLGALGVLGAGVALFPGTSKPPAPPSAASDGPTGEPEWKAWLGAGSRDLGKLESWLMARPVSDPQRKRALRELRSVGEVRLLALVALVDGEEATVRKLAREVGGLPELKELRSVCASLVELDDELKELGATDRGESVVQREEWAARFRPAGEVARRLSGTWARVTQDSPAVSVFRIRSAESLARLSVFLTILGVRREGQQASLAARELLSGRASFAVEAAAALAESGRKEPNAENLRFLNTPDATAGLEAAPTLFRYAMGRAGLYALPKGRWKDTFPRAMSYGEACVRAFLELPPGLQEPKSHLSACDRLAQLYRIRAYAELVKAPATEPKTLASVRRLVELSDPKQSLYEGPYRESWLFTQLLLGKTVKTRKLFRETVTFSEPYFRRYLEAEVSLIEGDYASALKVLSLLVRDPAAAQDQGVWGALAHAARLAGESHTRESHALRKANAAPLGPVLPWRSQRARDSFAQDDGGQWWPGRINEPAAERR